MHRLSTLSTIDEDDTQYEDFVTCAKKLSVELRAAGAEIVIAATHMRLANDKKLAENVGTNKHMKPYEWSYEITSRVKTCH